MSLKLKRLMSANDIISLLDKNCFYDDKQSNVYSVYNLYKDYEDSVLDDQKGGFFPQKICSYKDFCTLYNYAEEYLNDNSRVK